MADAPGPGSRAFRDSRSGELIEAVYDQLRAIAQQPMNPETAGHSLQATALVHEASLGIGRERRIPFENEAHFSAAAAEAMRRILIDHARARGPKRRGGAGGGVGRTPLSVV